MIRQDQFQSFLNYLEFPKYEYVLICDWHPW